MSIPENTAIVYRWFDALNRSDLDEAEKLWASNYTFSNPMGISDWKQLFSLFHRSFRDLRFTEEDIFGAGDKVATRWSMQGTQMGEFEGIPPTGKSVTMTGISIFRIVGDKITAQWIEFDELRLLKQLGGVLVRGQAM